MSVSPSRRMTQSAVCLAREALRHAEGVFPRYAHKFSPKKYTQAQLFAILAVRQFLGRDYRGIVVLLREWSDLREALSLESVPHYATLCYAAKRLLKKKAWTDFWTRPSAPPSNAA